MKSCNHKVPTVYTVHLRSENDKAQKAQKKVTQWLYEKHMHIFRLWRKHVQSCKKINIKMYEELCSWGSHCLYIEGEKWLSSQCGKKYKKKKFNNYIQTTCTFSYLALVAQLDAPSDWRPGGRGFNPRRGRQYSFVEIDHEIFSTVILSLPLIEDGQLSVSGERMCTILVNRLED